MDYSALQAKLSKALDQLDLALATQIDGILRQQHYHAMLKRSDVERLCEQFEFSPVQLALQLLPIAACYSHTPISDFHVGAIVRTGSGNFYFGANQEFLHITMAQTIHAEQSAISHAWLSGEHQITDVIVNYTPCGHCRQFMNELQGAEQLQIHLPHSQHNALHQYLPDAFGPKNLNIEHLLLDEQQHHLQLTTDDPLVKLALQAANQSYAPYSQSYQGVALQMQDSKQFQGRYAENAAFNPTLPALQTAVNLAFLHGYELTHIRHIALVERKGKLNYQTSAREFVATLPQVDWRYVCVEQ